MDVGFSFTVLAVICCYLCSAVSHKVRQRIEMVKTTKSGEEQGQLLVDKNENSQLSLISNHVIQILQKPEGRLEPQLYVSETATDCGAYLLIR